MATSRTPSAGDAIVTRTPLGHRVALVTGAGRRAGIGAAIARRLGADGARVLIHGWSGLDAHHPSGPDPGGAAALVAELRAQGAGAEHIDADLADPAAPGLLVERAFEAFGALDLLIANHARDGRQSLSELTAEVIDLTYAVNTRATLLLVQALAAMRPVGPGGRVVLFTSGQYHGAMPSELPYVASKAALQGLTASLAVELMPRGITVNCVNPGPTDTGYPDGATRAAIIAGNPGARWGTPQDAARLVAWLASDEAQWITGQLIASDGGWSHR